MSFTRLRASAFFTVLGSLLAQSHLQAQAQVLSLPELRITSIRGEAAFGYYATINEESLKHFLRVPPAAPGQPASALPVKPGARLYLGSTSHAVLALPGAGSCLVWGGCLRLPDAGGVGVSFAYDGHVESDPPKVFLNISAAEMAAHGGAVLRFNNKSKGNREQNRDPNDPERHSSVIVSSLGGRFFFNDKQVCFTGIEANGGDQVRMGCTLGVFDGSATIEELDSGQKVEVKPGTAVLVHPGKVHAPRPLTKQEQSYDLACKLAAAGRDAPAELPPAMKKTPKLMPGSVTNSLGMNFVLLPGTKSRICVHETRERDYAAYLAANPVASDYLTRPMALWGWRDHPVRANWDEAAAFCTWLSLKEGKKYRLPTDEEWSRAAGIWEKEKRKPNPSPADLGRDVLKLHSWGTVWPPPDGAENLFDLSRNADHPRWNAADMGTYDDGFSESAPVMSFSPNKLGIYDLGGNMAEWVEDWNDATRQFRVARGASYNDHRVEDLYLSSRKARRSIDRYYLGFRIVLEVP